MTTPPRAPRWAFMDKFEIPDLDDPTRNYLTRWRLVQTPWIALYLHRFDGPDSRPILHDHPWPFLSIVLRGGYTEHRMGGDQVVRTRLVTRASYMPVWAAHFIERLHREPTWTLVVVGRRQRRWGYWEPIRHAIWRWTAFDEHEYDTEFGAALDARAKAVR